MAEEHRCQAPRLCANNCGFFGSPATQNLCSKCYGDLQLKEHQKLALNQTLASSSLSSASSAAVSVSVSSSSPVDLPESSLNQAAVAAVEVKKEEKAKPSRCWTCRKRVGLTGFKCRCEMVFCGSHRYPEQHNCGFDFKSMGKEQIAKANPVIKAQKIDKI